MANSRPNSNVPIGDNFITGHDADLLFKSKLPVSAWLLRKQDPDFYLDYEIERVRDRAPSGSLIVAQVKGSRRGFSSRPRKQMETPHLQYYLKHRLAVFIFLVDLERKAVFWLFAQKYLREIVREGRLSRRQTITLTFDPKDNLDDLKRFEVAAEEAIKYVDNLHPSSIDVSVLARKSYLESLDPRFALTVDFVNGRERITARSKTDVVLKGTFTVDLLQAEKLLNNLHEHGTPATIPFKNLKFEGSPLFEELGIAIEEGVVSITPPTSPGALQLEFEDHAGRTQVLQLDGIWNGGRQSATLECGLAGTPLRCSSTIVPKEFEARKDTSMSFRFDWDVWANTPVSSLPRYEELFSFVEALEQNRPFKIHWLAEQKTIGTAKGHDNQPVSDAASTMQWLEACRYVARQLKVFPSVSSIQELPDDLWYAVIILKKLLRAEPVTAPSPDAFLELPVNKPQKAIQPDRDKPPADLSIDQCRTFNFLGREVKIRVLTTISEMTLEDVTEAEDGIVLKYRGSQNCTQTASLVRDDEGEPVFAIE